MNDLQQLHAALSQDDPSQDVVDRSRHRLQNRIAGGPASRKRTGWLTVGTGLTVAAAAAAVAIAVVPGAPVEGPSGGTDTGTQAKVVTGQEVLLAAATAAERAPLESGTYWHTKITTENDGETTDEYEYWTRADGHTWFRGVKTGGQVADWGALNANPFSLPGADMTLDQLLALPTEPEALKAAITDAIKNGDAKTSAGPIKDDPEFLAQAEFDSLIWLVSTVPAPPEVRAAAFRALATYPDVQNLGPVPGGQGLLLPGDVRFVVDPATGRVNGTSTFVTLEGGQYSAGDSGNTFRIDAEWVDTLPS
jgi:hypothetical protein